MMVGEISSVRFMSWASYDGAGEWGIRDGADRETRTWCSRRAWSLRSGAVGVFVRM